VRLQLRRVHEPRDLLSVARIAACTPFQAPHAVTVLSDRTFDAFCADFTGPRQPHVNSAAPK
jgi:hypothetical protein